MPSDALRCKIFFSKDNLPWVVERNYCQRLGFFVVERCSTGVVLAKRKDWYEQQKADNDEEPEAISEARMNDLNRRCARTFDAFLDPQRDKHHIKRQLQNFAQGLKDPLEVEYVENWIYNNVL